MAFIDQIIEQVNASITNVVSGYKHLINGVCDITDDGEDRLYIRTSTGQEYAVLDDRYEIICFHVAQETTYDSAEAQFGEGDAMYEAVTQVQLIAYAYAGTNMNNRTLGALMISALPSIVSIANQSEKGLYQTVIEPSSVNYNSKDVFTSLYPGVDYSISPKDCLVSVSYTVTSSIDRTCLPQCLNC